MLSGQRVHMASDRSPPQRAKEEMAGWHGVSSSRGETLRWHWRVRSVGQGREKTVCWISLDGGDEGRTSGWSRAYRIDCRYRLHGRTPNECRSPREKDPKLSTNNSFKLILQCDAKQSPR